MMRFDRLWMDNWPRVRAHHLAWWEQRGLVFWVTAPKDRPWEELPPPPEPPDLESFWWDAEYRARQSAYELSRTYFGGDAFPLARAWSGAGDLAAFLGSPIELSRRTIWYHPCIDDPPENHPPLRLDRRCAAFRKTDAMLRRMVELSAGRFFVPQPDLIENVDILASLRGTERLLLDFVDRPAWVRERLDQINQAFDEAFDHFGRIIRDVEGGNTFVFNLWGPGRTCKVQCDASAMFSPQMFRQFVLGPLRRQCRGLDYAMFHLDGEDCLPHLDLLLHELPEVRAIEWTPRHVSSGQGGGDPGFYSLYRRILQAGKSVQAISVAPEAVIPLLDAVGGRGMCITTWAPTEEEARRLAERVDSYR